MEQRASPGVPKSFDRKTSRFRACALEPPGWRAVPSVPASFLQGAVDVAFGVAFGHGLALVVK
ncbi:MAG: hypothetical protein IJ111_09640, partial [Eggerthellaceae bacterium]|nr:hypothetical protein [Eggerthellaceae bacterium]